MFVLGGERIHDSRLNSRNATTAPLSASKFCMLDAFLLNPAVSLLSEGRFSPIAKAVQNLVSSEGSTLHQLTNITKIFFNVLLLVAVNKKITVLLRVFIYYSIASITVTIIVLAPIIEASEDGGLAIGIITAITTLFDCYMMLLVRSIIVEIIGETPTKIVFTSHAKDENGQIKEPSVEITSPSPKQIEENMIEGDETLETVNESPNELISLVGIANDSYSPTILKVQETLIEDFVSKPIPILAYATELAFNVILLCAVYRKDLVLLRLFTYYCITAIIASAMLYSIVLAAVDVLTVILIVTSITLAGGPQEQARNGPTPSPKTAVFQIYLLLLVRSIMVEIQEMKDQNESTKLDFNTNNKDGDDRMKTDNSTVEIPLTPVPVPEEQTMTERDTRLETVEEHPHEVTV
ncbi:unnamed protein product [Diatraea saccharalis]|uniref:Uncharacterized protein n=1 Tax=Diatraea saccharalis TaxID=40085 RepID=A0A9N9WDD2_9NEOP|nr:unnamed protein product [Diatraea saccharalis]